MNPPPEPASFAAGADWSEIARFVADAQRDPTRHVTYVGEGESTILADFAEAARWEERCLVTREGGSISSVVLCDVDEEKRRAYWMGPWADDGSLMATMFDDARVRFEDLFDEEEMAPDARNVSMATLATSRDFRLETESDVLSLVGLEVAPMTSSVLDARMGDAIAALHDSIFPGTHRSGDHLADEGTFVRCIVDGQTPLGYIAFQVQSDGSGYIDYLGVAPAGRRKGIARALIQDACSALASKGATAAHLTVRADATGATELYQSVGFVRERTIAPYRLGFTLV